MQSKWYFNNNSRLNYDNETVHDVMQVETKKWYDFLLLNTILRMVFMCWFFLSLFTFNLILRNRVDVGGYKRDSGSVRRKGFLNRHFNIRNEMSISPCSRDTTVKRWRKKMKIARYIWRKSNTSTIQTIGRKRKTPFCHCERLYYRGEATQRNHKAWHMDHRWYLTFLLFSIQFSCTLERCDKSDWEKCEREKEGGSVREIERKREGGRETRRER